MSLFSILPVALITRIRGVAVAADDVDGDAGNGAGDFGGSRLSLHTIANDRLRQ